MNCILKPEYKPTWKPTGDLKADRLSFLQEDIDFYSVDPATRRSVADEDPELMSAACAYRSPSGTGCFIGRYIPDKIMEGMDTEDNTVSVASLLDNVPEALPAEVLALGYHFLIDCQKLHDSAVNWDTNGLRVGLSETGEAQAALIRKVAKGKHPVLTYDGE